MAAQSGHKKFPETLLPSELEPHQGWDIRAGASPRTGRTGIPWAALAVSCEHQDREFCALELWSGLRPHSELLGQAQLHSHGEFTGGSRGLQLPVHLLTYTLGAGGAESPWEGAIPSWDRDSGVIWPFLGHGSLCSCFSQQKYF